MKNVKNLKLYSSIIFGGALAICTSMGIASVFENGMEQGFKSAKITTDYYKDLNDYYKQQNEYLSEQNRLLYQGLLYINGEESQNLSVEGQKKLDEILDAIDQQRTEQLEQLQEQRRK